MDGRCCPKRKEHQNVPFGELYSILGHSIRESCLSTTMVLPCWVGFDALMLLMTMHRKIGFKMLSWNISPVAAHCPKIPRFASKTNYTSEAPILGSATPGFFQNDSQLISCNREGYPGFLYEVTWLQRSTRRGIKVIIRVFFSWVGMRFRPFSIIKTSLRCTVTNWHAQTWQLASKGKTAVALGPANQCHSRPRPMLNFDHLQEWQWLFQWGGERWKPA